VIVGFQGRKLSGKNEAARRLAQLASPAGWDVEFRAFANPLKDTVCGMYGIDRAELERLKEANGSLLNYPVRTLLQNFGESARKHFGVHLWLDLCLPRDFQHPEGRLVLVTDVRPDYECERVQELGGVVVRIDGGDEFDGHSTEVMGGEPDYFIDNTARSGPVLDAQLVRFWWWLACGAPRLAA
jgi:hypothetical protein